MILKFIVLILGKGKGFVRIELNESVIFADSRSNFKYIKYMKLKQ